MGNACCSDRTQSHTEGNMDKRPLTRPSYRKHKYIREEEEEEEYKYPAVEFRFNVNVDSTLEGLVDWQGVGHIAAVSPRDVKSKIWAGIFKTVADRKQPEIERLSKLLRTFGLLYLTRVKLDLLCFCVSVYNYDMLCV